VEARRRPVARGRHRPQDRHRRRSGSPSAVDVEAPALPAQDRLGGAVGVRVAGAGRRGVRGRRRVARCGGRSPRHRPAPSAARPAPPRRRGAGEGRPRPRGAGAPAAPGTGRAAVGRRRRHGQPAPPTARRPDGVGRRPVEAAGRSGLRRCPGCRALRADRGLRGRCRARPAAVGACGGGIGRIRRWGSPGGPAREEGRGLHRCRGPEPRVGRGRRDVRDRRRRAGVGLRRAPTAVRRVPQRGLPQGHRRGERDPPRAPGHRRPAHRARGARVPVRALRLAAPARHRPQRGLDPPHDTRVEDLSWLCWHCHGLKSKHHLRLVGPVGDKRLVRRDGTDWDPRPEGGRPPPGDPAGDSAGDPVRAGPAPEQGDLFTLAR